MATSSGSELNIGLNSDAKKYLEELQQWGKETFKEMQFRKEAQKAKITESLNQVQKLFEHPSFQNAAMSCNSAKSIESTVGLAKNNGNEMKSTSSNTKKFTKDTIGEPAATKVVSTEDIPLHACSQSTFQELVEQQMKKLSITNEKEEIKIPNAKSQAKRPFLKKGSGLQKFMGKPKSYPKKTVLKEQGNKEKAIPPSKNLKSRLPIIARNIANSASQKPRVQVVELNMPKEKVPVFTIIASKSRPSMPHSIKDSAIETEKEKKPFQEKCAPLTEKEVKELTQYEVLEDFANRVSFTSDSSLIMDVLNAEDAGSGKPAPHTKSLPQISTKTTTALDYDSSVPDFDLTTDLVYLRERKIELEKQLQSCDEELKEFENNTSAEIFNVSSSSDDGDAIKIPPTVTVPVVASEADKIESSSSTQALLREKIEEMTREIEVYKRENAVLDKLTEHREEELRAIQKHKEEFQKFKQEEIAKLNKHIAEKRQEIRRERETFERYQKLRTDLPNKSEREEIARLKQELESIRKEMKKPVKMCNAETKRLRNLLAEYKKKNEYLQNLHAEKEELLKRDNQKRVQSISNSKKKGRPSLTETKPKLKDSYNHQRNNQVVVEHDKENMEDELQSEFSPLKEDIFIRSANFSEDSYETEPEHHVRFNLEPEVQRFSPETHNSNYKEIQHGDSVERIYNNGDRQVFFQSGNRKFISADGLHVKYEYYNGDIQEIFPDKHKVYTYSSGVVERFYPDGLRIAEFLDGRVEKHYPDGSKEITDPCGKIITQLSNGIEEIRTQDGIKTTFFLNGAVVVEFPFGDKEIRTDDFIRREFASGAVKTVYRTGRSETRLPNGRFRVKDKDGNVLFDSITTL